MQPNALIKKLRFQRVHYTMHIRITRMMARARLQTNQARRLQRWKKKTVAA